MSKVVLIQPKSNYSESPHIPLGLLHIGTILEREGYEVRIIDAVMESNYIDLIDAECRDALAVGITALTSEVPHAIKLSDYIKRNFPSPVVWGGWHATLFPEQTCSDDSVDVVVMQEGEYSFLELVKAIEQNKPFAGIEGIVFKENGQVKRNSARPFLTMDELPPVSYELIPIDKYLRTSPDRAITYQSSRGCPYRCKFCINVVTGNNKGYRAKSASKVLGEIQALIQKYSVGFIIFVDDNLFLQRKRIEEIFWGIIDRRIQIKWFGECRADYFKEGFIDREFLRLAERSGLIRLSIGAESGSSAMLEKMAKGITVKDTMRSAEYLRDLNIIPSYSFMIGLLGEAKEDVSLTLNLIKKLKKICPQMEYGINTLRAYPRSELTMEIIHKGYFKEPLHLRDWQQEKVKSKYLGINKQPWHFDQDFVYSVSRYSNLAANTLSDEMIKGILRRPRPTLVGYVFFIMLARLRMKLSFFRLPVDLFVYDRFRGFMKKLSSIRMR